MLQAANIFNPLVPEAHNSECQDLPFPLYIKPVKVSYSLRIYIFCALGTNRLSEIDGGGGYFNWPSPEIGYFDSEKIVPEVTFCMVSTIADTAICL